MDFDSAESFEALQTLEYAILFWLLFQKHLDAKWTIDISIEFVPNKNKWLLS